MSIHRLRRTMGSTIGNSRAGAELKIWRDVAVIRSAQQRQIFGDLISYQNKRKAAR
jgi:hypothetical protein